MKIVLVADTFVPLRTSGAVQLRDLSREFARQKHDITVIVPSQDQSTPWVLEERDNVRILRLKAPAIKNVGKIRRTFGEFMMPFAMLWNFQKGPLAKDIWDGIIWYSPSIFHGPFVAALKRKSHCRGYLIIRDIFPEWAVDMGLMRRGLAYKFFKFIAGFQYSRADVIGVQTKGNLHYFKDWQHNSDRSLEVLPNWLGESVCIPCSIRVNETQLKDRSIFVYAGNMGVAQGIDSLIFLAERFRSRPDVGFLFVGRGSDLVRIKKLALSLKLQNIMFHDEIDPDQIEDLYAQCSAGIVALDPRHNTHNIPGKFLTYMKSGLPVLANINAGNDLSDIIRQKQVGHVCESNNLDDLEYCAHQLLKQIETDGALPSRCRQLFESAFSVDQTVHQIVKALIK